MSETMRAILPTLPDDLRPAARLLWERSRTITDEVTETLALSYRILREIQGRPEDLAAGAHDIESRVTGHLEAAQSDIDAAYPGLAAGWQGAGAEAFAEYVPRLSRAIEAAQDSAVNTVEAITVFRGALAALWVKVIERTHQTGGEVMTVVAAAGDYPLAATKPVIDIVERFARFVEELAEALLRLTSDSHQAGTHLRAAIDTDVAAGDGSNPRLPTPTTDSTAKAGWSPAHSAVSIDTAAMARMTSALDDAGDHWDAAAANSADIARDRLSPEAFGVAGSRFWGELHDVLDRDRRLYANADGQVTELATALRRIGVDYAEADDAAAAELRRGLDDD